MRYTLLLALLTTATLGAAQKTQRVGIGVGLATFRDDFSANVWYQAPGLAARYQHRSQRQDRPRRQYDALVRYARFHHPVLSEREEVQFVSYQAVLSAAQYWPVGERLELGASVSANAQVRLNDFLANGGSVGEGLLAVGIAGAYRISDRLEASAYVPLVGLRMRPFYDYSGTDFGLAYVPEGSTPALELSYALTEALSLGVVLTGHRYTANERTSLGTNALVTVGYVW